MPVPEKLLQLGDAVDVISAAAGSREHDVVVAKAFRITVTMESIGHRISPQALLLGFSSISHAPDRARGVIAYQQGTIRRDGYPDGATPDTVVIDHEASEEILVLTARMAVW